MNKIKLPELLSPAGNYEKMRAAFLYGADAVYVGGLRFGMRSASQNFSDAELEQAVNYAHSLNKKLYVTVNTLPREAEYEDLRKYLDMLENIRPDGIIVADLGVLTEIKKHAPHVPPHISTQASIVSPEAALAYASLGAKRLVLARELSLDEIKQIRKALPAEIEIEAFVHGSMCISYSGRCLLSTYMSGRDANRGLCTQPCRWNYALCEEKRPGQPMSIESDRYGTYIMSSKDMCTIEHIPELVEAGIDSFKIEGRVKSAYYTAVVTNAYRMALDSYGRDPGKYVFDPAIMKELESVSHREYCTGFYFDDPAITPQLCTAPGYIRDKAYLASALKTDINDIPAPLRENCEGLYMFCQHNKVCAGDRVEIISPNKAGRAFTANELYDIEGEKIESAPHPGMKYFTRVPFEIREGDIMRAAD